MKTPSAQIFKSTFSGPYNRQEYSLILLNRTHSVPLLVMQCVTFTIVYCVVIDIQQCFVVFDVLLINDKNLANCPLRERVEHLQKSANQP